MAAYQDMWLVRPLGFEPRTCGLRVRCSAIELEAPVVASPEVRHPLSLGDLVQRWLDDIGPPTVARDGAQLPWDLCRYVG
jgi:hypothetical protein